MQTINGQAELFVYLAPLSFTANKHLSIISN
jgi:hypothetical protein